MHISTKHLNDTVKSVTGFQVTYYIQQEPAREAKKLLFHSAMNIQQIAEQLDMENRQYFSRLFHKITGISPGAFRKQHRL